MKKAMAGAIISLLLLGTQPAVSAAPRIGGSCSAINKFQQSSSTLLICSLTKGKKQWRKATSVEKSFFLKEKTRIQSALVKKIIDDAKAEAARIILEAKVTADAAVKIITEKAAAEVAAKAAADAAVLSAINQASKEALDAAVKAAAEAAVKAAADAQATAIANAEKEAAEAKVACENKTVTIKVGLAYDIGGRGDKSFNDSAAAGLETAIRKLCISAKEITVTTASDSEREDKLRLLAKVGYNPIIAVGFLYAGPIKKVASDYPNVQFGIIDDSSVDLLNVSSLVFAEEQGSYLAGVAAALATKSGRVGYIGGVRIPLIQKFEAGFVAGVKATKNSVTVDVKYVSEPPDFGGFNDPAKAKVIANGMISTGADVIYTVAGGSALGSFQAAEDSAKTGIKVWTIGADFDQYLTVTEEQKKNMLTSVLKRIDIAVYDFISTAVAGSAINDILDPGSGIYGRRYGIARGGLSLSGSGGFLEQFWPAIQAAESSIYNGVVIVPTKPD